MFSLTFVPFMCWKLARATVRDPKTGVLTTANYRVSKRSVIKRKGFPVVTFHV